MRVVILGAWCDFATEDEYRQRLVRDGWPADEVENLIEDFREVERGFSSSQWHYLTLEDLERSVRTTVLPDDDNTRDEHPWEWLAGLLHVHGVEATAEELRRLPYEVVFSERLRARVAGA